MPDSDNNRSLKITGLCAVVAAIFMVATEVRHCNLANDYASDQRFCRTWTEDVKPEYRRFQLMSELKGPMTGVSCDTVEAMSGAYQSTWLGRLYLQLSGEYKLTLK